MKIPATHADIFAKKSFAHVATLMPDGTPQVTPVWVEYDGEHVLFNTSKGRQKDRNLQRDRNIALAVTDPDNPYRHIQVRGEVVSEDTEHAVDHINKLAKKYMDVDEYPYLNDQETRVIYKVRPDSISTMG